MRIESPHTIPLSAVSEQGRAAPNEQERIDDTSSARGSRANDSVELRQIVSTLRAELAIELPGDTRTAASVPSDSAAPAQQGLEAAAEGSVPQDAAANAPGQAELTPEEAREVEQLRARDREVRAHEQAHLAAAGPHAIGGPTYEYERGPDNRSYAVGGEVEIDTSPERDPEATLRKAQTVRRAALAPAQPSPQDRRVAAQAARMEAEARRELALQRVEEHRPHGGEPPAEGSTVEGRGTGAKADTKAKGHVVDMIA